MFHVPNQYRVKDGPMGSDDSIGNNGMFLIKEGQIDYIIIASDGEEWRPIKGWESLYEVSNTGKVRALPKTIDIPNGAKRIHNLIELSQENLKGYRRVTLVNETIRQKIFVHRLVASHFIDNPNSYPIINHIDGNRSNNMVTNLEWCTLAYNAFHSFEIGLQKGFKADEIRNIKDMIQGGATTREIALLFNRSRQAITDLKYGRHRLLTPDQPSKYTGLPLWEHVSVHGILYQNYKKLMFTLSWDEMCVIKKLFWDEEDCVIQYHPPKSEYKNQHPHVLHLWKPQDFVIPTPPLLYV